MILIALIIGIICILGIGFLDKTNTKKIKITSFILSFVISIILIAQFKNLYITAQLLPFTLILGMYLDKLWKKIGIGIVIGILNIIIFKIFAFNMFYFEHLLNYGYLNVTFMFINVIFNLIVILMISSFYKESAILAEKNRNLYNAIAKAKNGDGEAVRSIIISMLDSNEALISFGLTGISGIFAKTYDFYFLTNKRIGDVEIKPFTGEIFLESVFLDTIDAYYLNQPGIGVISKIIFFCLDIFWIGNFFRRVYLKIRKSGLIIKIKNASMGPYIFADRDKIYLINNLMNLLTKMVR